MLTRPGGNHRAVSDSAGIDVNGARLAVRAEHQRTWYGVQGRSRLRNEEVAGMRGAIPAYPQAG